MSKNCSDPEKLIESLLREFPEGLDVEEFIPGREFTVPLLEEFPGRFIMIIISAAR